MIATVEEKRRVNLGLQCPELLRGPGILRQRPTPAYRHLALRGVHAVASGIGNYYPEQAVD